MIIYDSSRQAAQGYIGRVTFVVFVIFSPLGGGVKKFHGLKRKPGHQDNA